MCITQKQACRLTHLDTIRGLPMPYAVGHTVAPCQGHSGAPSFRQSLDVEVGGLTPCCWSEKNTYQHHPIVVYRPPLTMSMYVPSYSIQKQDCGRCWLRNSCAMCKLSSWDNCLQLVHNEGDSCLYDWILHNNSNDPHPQQFQLPTNVLI